MLCKYRNLKRFHEANFHGSTISVKVLIEFKDYRECRENCLKHELRYCFNRIKLILLYYQGAVI